ncbi:MAG: hypothetical protein COA42_06420 [Alteromonadaceae bacterium]|nr:MAG: hypothetical protein COA42_06420 [Alteromonadaceae bacterium]
MSFSPRTQMATGVANSKKAEIDSLTDQINNAQYEVDQLTAVVQSLTAKSTQFSQFLNEADSNKTMALGHLNKVTDIASSAKHTRSNTITSVKQTREAKQSMSQAAEQVSYLINKLILAVELIDKQVQSVNKLKASNPIIPDQLISELSKASTDANNAIATTLTSISSGYAAEASLLEAFKIAERGYVVATNLHNKIIQTGNPDNANTKTDLGKESAGIQYLLQDAYDQAVKTYGQALAANDIVTVQLAFSQTQLDDATASLNSLNSGYSAAEAAAFAA